MTSWRTTAAAVSGLLVLVFTALGALIDGDPTTQPDWNPIFVMAAPLVGLIFARDNKVSSKEAGAE
jgi:hypothetical protein